MREKVLGDTLLLTCIILSGTSAFAAHYFVERYDLWRRGIHILVRYTIGIICIIGPFALWSQESGGMDALTALCLLATAAGLATLLAYLIDGVRLGRQRGDDLECLGVGDGQD